MIRPRSMADSVAIIRTVADYYRVPPEKLMGDNRTQTLRWPRYVARALVRDLTPGSYPEIAALFGIHHASAIYAIKRVEEQCVASETFAAEFYTCREIAKREIERVAA